MSEEEVLVHADQPDGVAGEPAQRGGEGGHVGQQVVRELRHPPLAVLTDGGEREVDDVELLGHATSVPLQ